MSDRLPTLRRLADERGQSLVLALLVLTVLAVVLGTVITFTAGNQRNADLQKASQVARSLAEAGVNNGVSVVSNPANANALRDDGSTPSLSPALLPDQANAYTSTYQGGTVQWWGTYAPGDPACPPSEQDANGNTVACVGIWTLHGRSTVANPTGAADLHRTMTAKLAVYTLQNSYTADVWNWVYSPYSSGTNQCDTSFSNSLTLNVRVWVGGNLCANNTVQFNRSLYVGGYLNLGNPQASVGSQNANVNATYVGNGCWYVNNPVYNPCVVNGTGATGNGKKSGAQTNVYSNSLYTNPTQLPGTVFDGVTAPPLCWGQGDCPPDSTNPIAGGWYSVASPGPLHPCDVASTQPAGNPLPVFDNLVNGETSPVWGPAEGYSNGSVPGVFNLTPDGYSYTCQTAAGELSWSNTTRTLTVRGVVFIDGSATAYTSGNTPVTYTGSDTGTCATVGSCQSVLFLSGTFLMTREQLCAVVNTQGNGCDTSSWDPNKKILIVLTHGDGGQLPAGDGVEVTTNQAFFQGGLYAKSSIVISSGGSVQGPLVSGLQTVTDGQSGDLSFPTLTLSPFAINQPPALQLCDPAASSSLPCRPFDYTG